MDDRGELRYVTHGHLIFDVFLSLLQTRGGIGTEDCVFS